jgi:hypothetical protein
MVEDDGAPTPIKGRTDSDRMRTYSDTGLKGLLDTNDEMLSVSKITMTELLEERDTLYAEILRYKDENTMLFRDLGTAEDLVEELQEEVERLKSGV